MTPNQQCCVISLTRCRGLSNCGDGTRETQHQGDLWYPSLGQETVLCYNSQLRSGDQERVSNRDSHRSIINIDLKWQSRIKTSGPFDLKFSVVHSIYSFVFLVMQMIKKKINCYKITTYLHWSMKMLDNILCFFYYPCLLLYLSM